jgi:hypothetical protein
MRHTLAAPTPPPRKPFRAAPIPRTGQRGLASDAQIADRVQGLLARYFAPREKESK